MREMRTLTRKEALANLAHANVVTEARLVDAHVRTEDDLRDAKRESALADARVYAEAVSA